MEHLDTAGNYTAVTIAANIHHIKSTLPDGVELVAVSKFHPAEAIMAAYQAGQRIFGESRAQELTAKAPVLPDDIRWHFIGHLQRNKIRQIMPHVSLIESVDSERLLNAIDRISGEEGRITRVLMQVHVAAEETKFGFSPDELLDYFRNRRFEKLTATHICGIMGMATNTDNNARVAADFQAIHDCFTRIREIAPGLRGFDIVSMGMSDDYPMAISHGSTLVRVGTAIFGHRQY